MPTRRCSGGTHDAPLGHRAPVDLDRARVGPLEARDERSSVVLPQPEGPSSATTSPRSTQNEVASTATVSPKRFVTASSRIIEQACKGNLTPGCGAGYRSPGRTDTLAGCHSPRSTRSSRPARSRGRSRTRWRRTSREAQSSSVGLGGRRLRGIVVETGVEAPAGVDIAAAGDVVDRMPPALVDLALWLADYYGSTPRGRSPWWRRTRERVAESAARPRSGTVSPASRSRRS